MQLFIYYLFNYTGILVVFFLIVTSRITIYIQKKKFKIIWFLFFLNSGFFSLYIKCYFWRFSQWRKNIKYSRIIIINSTLLFKKIFSTNIGYSIRKWYFNVKQKKINYTNIPQEKFAHYFSIYSIHILIIYCTSEDSFLKKKKSTNKTNIYKFTHLYFINCHIPFDNQIIFMHSVLRYLYPIQQHICTLC